MRKNFTLSMDRELVSEAKKVAGRMPFSRFVEDLLEKEIQQNKRKAS